MKTKRSYTMRARAQAVEETRRRILQGAFELAGTRMVPEITLEQVASRAGVSVQTILRQFGSRAGMVQATMDYAFTRVAEERAAPVGDVDAAVRTIVSHYELRGSTSLLMLAQETRDDEMAALAQRGRQLHRAWVAEVFAPYVTDDDALVDLLVVATDVYTWKLLRQDRRLSRAATENRIHRLVEAILEQRRKELP